MYRFRCCRWTALAVAFGLTVPAVRAEMITPDSIPNPPSAVGSADGTSVSATNVVTTQYAGLGLDFAGGSAITHLTGSSVWAPIYPGGSSPIDYSGAVTGNLVSPGSSNPTTVSSLSVEIISTLPGFANINVSGLNGQLLNIFPSLQMLPGPHGGHVFTFTGSGISSFNVNEPVMGPPPSNPMSYPPWGIAAVSFTSSQATTPEPSSLVLAGLGALSLAARFDWRRKRTAARSS